MKLFASATSPYARKVRIALSELGFADRVQIIQTAATEDEGFRAVNPLGKIPALALDDGTVIYDSLVILDWLDNAAGGDRLIPREPEARNAELRRHALANGIIDAAFSAAMELRRPEDHLSAFWLARWSDTITVGARELAGELSTELTLSAITAISALDYVEFRLGGLGLDLAPLTAWRSGVTERPIFASTLPDRPLN